MAKHGIVDLKTTNSSKVPDIGYDRIRSSTTGIQIIKSDGTVKNISTPWELPVINNTTLDPSILTPSISDRYIVPISAIGVWSGYDNRIAQWDGTSWYMFIPVESWTCYSKDANTIFIFDGSIWSQISQSSETVNKTELAITGTINGSTTFSTIASGTNYTMSGANGNLEISELLFRENNNLQIEICGTRLDKSDDILWVNSQSFQLIGISVDSGDKIIIFS